MYKSNLIAKSAKIIPYNPRLRRIAKSVTGCILFQQLEYWFDKTKGEAFYKFTSPCQHPAYHTGDSWTEELGFSRAEFRNAWKQVGITYKSRRLHLKAKEEDREFGKDNSYLYCCYHDKKSNLTYYIRNHDSIDGKISELLTEIETQTEQEKLQVPNLYKSTKCISRDQQSASLEINKVHLHIQENTTEITTGEYICASNKTQIKKESNKQPRAPFRDYRQQETFDTFWRAYPKKRSKGQAEKAWIKILPDEQLFTTIIDGLKRARGSPDWVKDGGKYIPHPATWLNARGWEDEITTGGGNNELSYCKRGNLSPFTADVLADIERANRLARLSAQKKAPN